MWNIHCKSNNNFIITFFKFYSIPPFTGATFGGAHSQLYSKFRPVLLLTRNVKKFFFFIRWNRPWWVNTDASSNSAESFTSNSRTWSKPIEKRWRWLLDFSIWFIFGPVGQWNQRSRLLKICNFECSFIGLPSLDKKGLIVKYKEFIKHYGI